MIYLSLCVLGNKSIVDSERLLRSSNVGWGGQCSFTVSVLAGSSGNENYSMTSRSALPHRTYLDETACCTEEIHQFGLWSHWFGGFQACRVMKERWPRAT